jgi:peptidoglycan hydrolase-like protein with peptidoglycan-binding domain
MNVFRAAVANIMDGTTPTPPLIPRVEPSKPGAPAGRPTLRRGATGDPVKVVQAKVGVAADGTFGAETEAAVRAFQQGRNLVPDGIVGPKTWAEIDKPA